MTFVCGDDGADGRRAADVDHLGRPRRRASTPARSSTWPTARCACASSAVRAGDGEIDAEVEVGGTVASRQGLNIPGELDSAARGARGGPRAPARRREDRRRPRRAVVRAPRPRTSTFVREHTRAAADRQDREAAGASSAPRRSSSAADCVMVARGDLGIELPHRGGADRPEAAASRWPARWRGPSITATQMLDSMVTSSRPTRAEVTDVANAILDGTDAVMLSQETAVGAVPGRGDRDDGRRSPSTTERERALRAAGTRSACAATSATPPTRSPTPPARAARELEPRRARRPDAVGPLGAAGLRAPPDGADLRALARARDRAPLRADVGRAGGVDAPPRGHRGADRRRRRAASSSSAGASRASASASPPGCRAASPGTTSLFQVQQV